MSDFYDSPEFEKALAKFVWEMDLPLCLSRAEHIKDWQGTFDFDDVMNAFISDEQASYREGVALDNARDSRRL